MSDILLTSTNKIVVGLDPGARGAVAVFVDGHLAQIFGTPAHGCVR